MEYIKADLRFNSDIKQIEVPKLCPNCGVANNPTSVTTSQGVNTLHEKGKIHLILHRCPVCNKYHVTIQEMADEKSPFKCIMYYPKYTAPGIDKLLLEHCPNFVKFYSEAVEAENNELYNIAAIGLRASIECLIKDYAVDFNLDSEEKIAKQKFNNVIDMYIKDDDLLKGSLHFIRKIGNDYTHWKSEYDIPYYELKSYVEIVIQVFTSKLKMKYPPI